MTCGSFAIIKQIMLSLSLALAVEFLELLEFFRALRIGLLAANEHGIPNVSLS